MKRYSIILAGFLMTSSVFGQGRLQLTPPVVLPTATATTLGGVRIGAGLIADNTGLVSATVYTNTAMNQAGIQSAITSATANSRVLLAPGTYTLTSNLLIQAKTGLILDGGET